MPERRNFPLTAGDTLTVRISNATLAGVAVDLTGWTVFFTAKERKSDPDAAAVLKLRVTDHLDPTNGTTVVHLSARHTRAISKAQYGRVYYDIQFVSPDGGIVKTSHVGEIVVTRDITHRTN